MRSFFLIFVLILLQTVSHAQDTDAPKAPMIDVSIFSDAAHHWYDIKEKGAVILPRPGHPQYKPSAITAIADNILLYQKDNGGWPKNYDMQAVLTPEQADSLLKARYATNTTFDYRIRIHRSGTWLKCMHTRKY